MKNTNSLVIDTSTHRSNQNLTAGMSSPSSRFVRPHPHPQREVNGNDVNYPRSSLDKFEVPLPFGYHMDLDFLRMMDDSGSVSGETLGRLKELRRQRRKQRKTLEALMVMQNKQQQHGNKVTSASVTRYATTGSAGGVKRSPKPLTVAQVRTRTQQQQHQDTAEIKFVSEALKDAVEDFEHQLERSIEEEKERMNNADLMSTRTSRFNTFPRVMSPDLTRAAAASASRADKRSEMSTFKLFRPCSNSSISSVSTISLTNNQNNSGGNLPASTDAVLSALPSSVPQQPHDSADAMETESIASIASDMSTNTLRNVREQMARSLVKIKEYEKQVESIPVLQAKLSVLKEEKRLLLLRLKQREIEMRREHGEELDEDELGEESEAALYYDTEDDEFLDEEGGRGDRKMKRPSFQDMASSRARSESPYARGGVINPDDFISTQKRSASACGYNSNSDLSTVGNAMPTYSYNRMNWRKNQPEGVGRMSKARAHHNLSTSHLAERRAETFQPSKGATSTPVKKAEVREKGVMTDPVPEPPPKIVEVIKRETPPPRVMKRERGVNTDPPPRSPPPPRKYSLGVNTVNVRTISKGVGTLMASRDIYSKQEMEDKVQAAVLKTEEEIMGCPLLQRAMAKVEEEAIHGPKVEAEKVDGGCQVGEENLRPFVISVGLQCKLDESRPIMVESSEFSEGFGGEGRVQRRSLDPETEKLVRSVGVGDYKLVEDPVGPIQFRDAAVCTEKWVEVIKASKQTDTEDFAYKDTESPRVADLFRFEASPERVVLERRSSLRRGQQGTSSPSMSRRSSTNSPIPSRKSSALSTANKTITRTQGTMTLTEVKLKVPTRDAKVGAIPVTKSVSTSAMELPGLKQMSSSFHLPAPGSPLTTPEIEKPPVSVCDKCISDIQKVAKGVLEGPQQQQQQQQQDKSVHPPPLDMPWLSKIPRPVENTSVQKLKAASSIGNLSSSSKSPTPSSYGTPMQRSKSSLTPAQGRRLVASPGTAIKSPITVGRRDVGTPPPHPGTPPINSGSAVRRVSSPLARSQSPHAPVSSERKSLIPKPSPGAQRKQLGSASSKDNSTPTTPTVEGVSKSLIPRVVTPPALRKMFPKGADKLAVPDRNVVRKNTFTKISVGLNKDLVETSSSSAESDKVAATLSAVKEREAKEKAGGSDTDSVSGDEEKKKGFASGGFPLPGAALFTPINANRKKAEPSKEMRAALKVLNDSIGRASGSSGSRGNAQVTNAVNIIQQEWFKVSSTKMSNPLDVEDYLDAVEDLATGKGTELLSRIVNMSDVNGNTALHYSVSHGNFDVVSILLDSKVANPNMLNKAGYTSTMLVSLARLASNTHRSVVARLFGAGDVNLRATQHGQTALMLAASHGRQDMVELLTAAGADVNVRDEDGSTALMCAAEHGHMEVVKFLLQQGETNVLAKDNDGLTALAVAMEAGHRDIGVVLYANMSFSRGSSPYSSMRIKRGTSTSRTSTPTAQTPTNVGPTPPTRGGRHN